MTPEQLNVLSEIDTHELTTYLRNKRHTAFILWQKIDIVHRANEIGFLMSQKEAENIISRIDRFSDCNHGISWEIITYHIEEWIEDNSFEVVIKELNNSKNKTVKFCAINTNENIEHYWNDDDYYFYGLSKVEVQDFIEKKEMIADSLIIKVL